MKRLIKKSDAARLEDGLKLNSTQALSAIQSYDNYFNQDNLKNDADETRAHAKYGAISDNAKYVAEAYIYEDPQVGKRCTIVIDEILFNGESKKDYNLSDNINVLDSFNIERDSEIISKFESKSFNYNGDEITFKQTFQTLENALEYANQNNQNEENKNE
jgi:hypothetical protein